MMHVSKSVSRNQSNGPKSNQGRLRGPSAVRVLEWPEEYISDLLWKLIQIVSRDGTPFSMDVFRKVYDVSH